MLIPDFYTIVEFENSESQIMAKIKLNSDHEVYEGHFPDQPVVPGVIQLQIIKELLEKASSKTLFMSELIFAKYLQMIVPGQSPLLDIIINYGQKSADEFSCSATISTDGIKYTKLKGLFNSNGDFSRLKQW